MSVNAKYFDDFRFRVSEGKKSLDPPVYLDVPPEQIKAFSKHNATKKKRTNIGVIFRKAINVILAQ